MSRALSTLPIGLPRFALRPSNGVAELAIAWGARSGASRPERVTRVLAAALERIDEQAVSTELLLRLSAGTREWLLQKVAALFRPANDWFEAGCSICGARYDFLLDLGALPTKPAGEGFPVVNIETSLGPRQFDLPNGADEARFVSSGTQDDPRRYFAELCGLSADAAGEAQRFTEDDLLSLDQGFDAAAPQPSDRSATGCPDCGHVTEAAIDPLAFAFPGEMDLLGEVHRLAVHYHWNEDTILALPTRRRRQYLALVRADAPGRRAGRPA
ncbi:MAG: hypothetical protein WBA73_02810 [Devosia sp.]